LFAGAVIGKNVMVIKTGIGEKEISPGIFRHCSSIISTGFCGALSAELKTCEIVLSESVALQTEAVNAESGLDSGKFTHIEREPPETANFEQAGIELTDKNLALRETAEKIIAKAGIQIHRGPTVTVKSVISTPEEKKHLAQSSGSLSLEMEDYFRFQRACRLGIPFLSLRAVLDEHDERVPRLRSRLPSKTRAKFLKKANACSRRIADVLLLLTQSPDIHFIKNLE